MRQIFPFIFMLILACNGPTIFQDKINGICFTAPPQAIGDSSFVAIKNTGANAIALIPYAFVNRSNQLIFDHPNQWWGERSGGMDSCIQMAQSLGLRIMIKPHLWIPRQFTGQFTLSTEKEWTAFEEQYLAYLSTYALMAEKYQVELLCIGTEMESFSQLRPAFWLRLIERIRELYSGSITYAANWDEMMDFPYWPYLDAIGIDAYFPLAKGANPSIEEIDAAWEPHFKQMEKLSGKFNKPIIFAEYGYRSVDFATEQPWLSDTREGVNLDIQTKAFQALFDRFYPEPWFAGGFIWKWFHPINSGGEDNNRFTPQNKPALDVIRKQFENN